MGVRGASVAAPALKGRDPVTKPAARAAGPTSAPSSTSWRERHHVIARARSARSNLLLIAQYRPERMLPAFAGDCFASRRAERCLAPTARFAMTIGEAALPSKLCPLCVFCDFALHPLQLGLFCVFALTAVAAPLGGRHSHCSSAPLLH